MKKFSKVITSVVAMFVLCFTLCACGKTYTSQYKASRMKESNTPKEASVSFENFSGTYVIKLTNSGGGEAVIAYNATLGAGNIKVYYDFNGEKLDLFEIGTDGSIEGKTEAFTGNKTIYIIIESDGNCGAGSFSFVLEK